MLASAFFFFLIPLGPFLGGIGDDVEVGFAELDIMIKPFRLTVEMMMLAAAVRHGPVSQAACASAQYPTLRAANPS